MDNFRLIVGLGNPGEKYSGTRHNVGFRLVELLAERWRVDWKNEKRFQSRVCKAERGGLSVTLCQPQTFMNASGEAVGALATYYRLTPERLLVVVDDADLALGGIRLRASGSSGGHHGLESIEQHLGTRDFPRLRMGIGRTAEGAREITGHVLGRFSEAERGTLERVLTAAAAQVERWLSDGIAKAMNEFNGVVKDAEQQRKSD